MLPFVVIMDGMIGIYLQTLIQKKFGSTSNARIKLHGIPGSLKNTSFPFPYNNFEYLKKLIKKKKLVLLKWKL